MRAVVHDAGGWLCLQAGEVVNARVRVGTGGTLVASSSAAQLATHLHWARGLCAQLPDVTAADCGTVDNCPNIALPLLQTDVNLPFITADASGAKHLQMTLTR